MKKFLTILVLVFIVWMVFSQKTQTVDAIGSILRSGIDFPSGSFAMETSNSTTTPNYLQTGQGTTTLTFLSDNLSAVTITAQVFASSSVKAAIEMYAQSSDNNIDWFDYDLSSGSSLSSTTLPTRSYLPTTVNATSTKSFDLKLLPARYTRLVWSVQATSSISSTYKDGYDLWVNVIGQNSGVH